MKTIQVALNIRLDLTVPDHYTNEKVEELLQEMDYELKPLPIDNDDNISFETEMNGWEIINRSQEKEVFQEWTIDGETDKFISVLGWMDEQENWFPSCEYDIKVTDTDKYGNPIKGIATPCKPF